ncbi:MAG: hypothetical protein NTY31_01095 [Candidatus Falkowbacteria bacterium]|nr:hypothetical protein [Candidatus Falkowbacteria bacterium]
MVSQPVKNQNSLNLFLNNYFNIILAVVLILFLFFAYLVFLSPKFRATQAAISANTEEKQLLYETTQKKLASLKIISEIYQKISPSDLQKFNSVLPDSYARERLFGELEEIISRGGWLISSITISPEEVAAKAPAPVVNEDGTSNPASAATLNNKKVGTVSLQLSLTAIDYPGFKNLLRILENNLRLFDITSVEFSPEADAATVVITTYYYQSP